jgi:hypothetical protein
LHDVGRAADAAGEELGLLEDRRLDPLVAGALEGGGGDGLYPCPSRRLGGQDVEGAPGGLELTGHAGKLFARLV